MHKEKRDKHFIKKPSYPGGRKAMQEFIKANLKYPADALEAKVEGTVSLKYTINHKGDVIETHVISGIGHGCDDEARRLAGLLKFEVPKVGRKVRVTFTKDLHVHFRLPKQKLAKNDLMVNYTYQVTKQPAKSDETASSTSYSYTIKLK